MSKTYQALVKAEQLRAAQDPAALERRVTRAAEEGETLRAELRVCQQQIATILEKVDGVASPDPAVIDNLGRQVARIAAQQERLAAEPWKLLEAELQRFREELDRRWALLQRQSEQVAGLSQRLEQVQGNVVPTIETLGRGLGELEKRADELQRTQLAERQTLTATIESLRDAVAQATLSLDEQRREQRRLLDELAAVHAAQQDGLHQAQRSAALGESVDSVRARLDQVDSIRADADRLRAQVQDLQRDVDHLRVASIEAEAPPASLPPEAFETLRAEIDALREQLAAADQSLRVQQQEVDDRPAGSPDEQPSPAAPAIDAMHASVEKLQAGQQGLAERLAALKGLQSRSERRLHEVLGMVEPLLTEQPRVAAEIDALGLQVSALTDAQSRQQQRADSAERAQASAEDGARRAAATAEAHASTLAALEQRLAELQIDQGSLRKALSAAQAAATEQLSAGLGDLIGRIEPLVAAQPRLNEIADAAVRAQSTADEAGRRLSASQEAQDATVAELRQRLDALQADSSRWQEVSSAVQGAAARQEESATEIDALRIRVTRMTEFQQRQQDLFEDLRAVPAIGSGGSVPLEAEDASDVSVLQRQIVALQADRLRLDAFLETRFELLCELLDSEMQAKLDEIRGSVSGPVEAPRLSRQVLTEGLARWTSSIAALRKKTQ